MYLKIPLKHISDSKTLPGILTALQQEIHENLALSFQVLSTFNECQIFNNNQNS